MTKGTYSIVMLPIAFIMLHGNNTSAQIQNTIISEESEPVKDDDRNARLDNLGKVTGLSIRGIKDSGKHFSKGAIAYAITPPDGNAEIFLINADGSKIAFARSFSSPTWRSEIWVMNADGSNVHRLGNAEGQGPDWSPDGKMIAFISMRDGHYEMYTMNADGSNQTRITNSNGHAIDPDWKPATKQTSPDCRYLFVHWNGDLWWIDAKGIEMTYMR